MLKFMGVFVLIIGELAFAGSSEPQIPNQAVQAYDAGNYKEAVTAFEKLVSQGINNGHLFYNLGNAYYRDGQIGAAMAAFLAARRLLPRDPDVRANLRQTHAKIVDKLDVQMPENAMDQMMHWTRKLTALEWCWIGTVFWVLGLLFLTFIQFRSHSDYTSLLRRIGAGLTGLALVAGVITIYVYRNTEVWAAVVVEKAEVYSGPGRHNTKVFEVHRGAPLQFQQRHADWAKVALSDGKKGWIALEQIRAYGLASDDEGAGSG